MKLKLKKIPLFPILIIFISLLPLLDYFHPGLPKTHDGQDHVARIANFYQNLTEGNIIPRWAENLNWGYGHPILMFLYPLPSYIASFFHFIGFNFVDSTKLVFILSYVLSGLTMYLWLKQFLSKHAAYIGGLLYILAPYRFVDLYVRAAIGEHVAFVFPPLVLYFLYKLSKKSSIKNLTLGSLSLAGLILAHNAISLMFLPIIFLYGIFLFSQTKIKKSFLINSFLIILFSFSMSAFFWLPALLEGKYTLRDIVTENGYLNRFANFSQFIYGPWNYGESGEFTLQVGILHWLSVILSIPLVLYFYKKKNKLWIFTLSLIIIFAASLFIIDKSSQLIWQHISLIQKFQFPWRFLSVTVFAASVLGAGVISILPKKNRAIVLVFLSFLIIFVNKDYWYAKSYLNKPEVFYTSVYQSTTDTGESAPIWSVRFMEEEPETSLEIIDGNAKIKQVRRTSTYHQYQVRADSETRLRENTLYFPGWQVLVDGKEAPIQFQDPENRGVMTFNVEKGKHLVELKFTETKLRLFADIISLVSFLILIIIVIRVVFFYKK